MKRVGRIFDKIASVENLVLADSKARKGKKRQYGIIHHDRNRESNILALHEMLVNKTYKTSKYTTFKVYEPKERIVYRLPYFPDRILHHAILNYMEPIWTRSFVADSYSCIKGRGIHRAGEKLKKVLKDTIGAKYCLKLDVQKFYPSIDNEILKQVIRRKIKDKDLLWLLDEIIGSAQGCPIGNFLSQFFANLYLSGLDHWLKEVKKVKYFRYCDDMVILGATKEELHSLFQEIKEYLETKLKLTIKKNYRVFPVDKCGIDFLGFVYRSTHTRLRKRIKQNFARAVAKDKSEQSIASYMGWALYSDSKNLVRKLLPNHEKFLTIQHQAKRKSIRWRKDIGRKNIKPANNGSGIQDCGIQI